MGGGKSIYIHTTQSFAIQSPPKESIHLCQSQVLKIQRSHVLSPIVIHEHVKNLFQSETKKLAGGNYL